MVKLPESMPCPTLAAMNAAMEAKPNTPRPYLGMSEIGRECEYALWLGFRWAAPVTFYASTLKAFEDGHISEDLMVKRLSLVVNLHSQQITFSDFGGHFSGHGDGLIDGLLQAPKTTHVWEHKCTNEIKFNKLDKLRSQNEKTALEQWDIVYYAQAQLYMHYGKYSRHYLTCSTAGSRNEIAVRTEYNKDDALKLIEKAKRIIFSETGPQRISDNDAFYICKMCNKSDVCRGRALPQRNCRTCAHVTVRTSGNWHCSKHDYILSEEVQREGCDKHRFNPNMIPSPVVSVEDGKVTYKNGFVDG